MLWRGVTLRSDFVDHALEAVGIGTNQFVDLFAAFENDKGRNALNAVAHRNLGVRINVYLGKEYLTLILVAHALVERSNSKTGATPRSPEINDNGCLRGEDSACKIFVFHIYEVGVCIHYYLLTLSSGKTIEIASS